MRAQMLTEFAEDMRCKGDIRQSDLADEILALIDIESDVADPYSDICADLENDAPEGLKDKPEKVVEWLVDRSNVLGEIEKLLDEDGRTGDTDDQVKALLEMFAKIRDIIGVPDEATDEDVENAVQELADRAQPMEYDL